LDDDIGTIIAVSKISVILSIIPPTLNCILVQAGYPNDFWFSRIFIGDIFIVICGTSWTMFPRRSVLTEKTARPIRDIGPVLKHQCDVTKLRIPSGSPVIELGTRGIVPRVLRG